MAVLVVAGAILKDQRVLAARRAPHKRQAGLWELPGGKVEAGEPQADALIRELQEELGIEVAVGERLAESVHRYAHAEVRLVAWRCELLAGEPAGPDHDRLEWVDAERGAELSWAPADVPLLPAVWAALREEEPVEAG